jgi:DNA-binding MarR family transcriptional regulator
MDKLRGVIIGLSTDGKDISNALIFQALALETEPEKARVRRQLNDMVKQNELKRIKPGQYTYNPKAPQRRGEGYVRMWRAVRASTGTFQISEIAAVSHTDASSVSKYLKCLIEAGYVRRNGKKGQVRLFSTTPKGRDQRETPYPPVAIRDPFAKERAAMSRLARVFFEKDLYSESARKAAVKECETIMARFAKQD